MVCQSSGRRNPRLVLNQIPTQSKGNPDANRVAKPKQHPRVQRGRKRRVSEKELCTGIAPSLLVAAENTVLFPREKKKNNQPTQRSKGGILGIKMSNAIYRWVIFLTGNGACKGMF